MGLTLIEAAKVESRLEHLAVIKTFSEGDWSIIKAPTPSGITW